MRTYAQSITRKIRRDRLALELLGRIPTEDLAGEMLTRKPLNFAQSITHVQRFPIKVVEHVFKLKGGVTGDEMIRGMTKEQLWRCLAGRFSAAILQFEEKDLEDRPDGTEVGCWFVGTYSTCQGLAHGMGQWARSRDKQFMDQVMEDEDDVSGDHT